MGKIERQGESWHVHVTAVNFYIQLKIMLYYYCLKFWHWLGCLETFYALCFFILEKKNLMLSCVFSWWCMEILVLYLSVWTPTNVESNLKPSKMFNSLCTYFIFISSVLIEFSLTVIGLLCGYKTLAKMLNENISNLIVFKAS